MEEKLNSSPEQNGGHEDGQGSSGEEAAPSAASNKEQADINALLKRLLQPSKPKQEEQQPDGAAADAVPVNTSERPPGLSQPPARAAAAQPARGPGPGPSQQQQHQKVSPRTLPQDSHVPPGQHHGMHMPPGPAAARGAWGHGPPMGMLPEQHPLSGFYPPQGFMHHPMHHPPGPPGQGKPECGTSTHEFLTHWAAYPPES